MAIYVLRSVASDGARSLAEALNGRRIFKRQGGLFSGRAASPRPITLRRGDAVVCWGTPAAPPPVPNGVKILNGTALQSKYTDAIKLREAGVATIEVRRDRPQAVQPPAPVDPAIAIHRDFTELIGDFRDTAFARTIPYQDGLRQLNTSLQALINAVNRPVPVAPPAPPQGEWLGRSNSHQGGTDLLRPGREAVDYYVKKEDLVREFRVHSFRGKSIRAGIKKFRDGFTVDGLNHTQRAHAWVRSWDGGWRIVYDGVSSKKKHREIAHAAVAALGLDFGAVDIGEKRDGSLIVLEVNRAPGVENGTVDSYARAVEGWVNE